MSMQGQTDEFELVKVRRRSAWPTSCAMFIALVLLFVTFFWVFIRLEPVLSDVVEQNNVSPVITPTESPSAAP